MLLWATAFACREKESAPAPTPVEPFVQTRLTQTGDLQVINSFQSADGSLHYLTKQSHHSYNPISGFIDQLMYRSNAPEAYLPGINEEYAVFYNVWDNIPTLRVAKGNTNGAGYIFLDSLGLPTRPMLSLGNYTSSTIAVSPFSEFAPGTVSYICAPLFEGRDMKILLFKVLRETRRGEIIDLRSKKIITLEENFPYTGTSIRFNVWYGNKGFYVCTSFNMYRVELDGTFKKIDGLGEYPFISRMTFVSNDTVTASSVMDGTLYLSVNGGRSFTLKYQRGFLNSEKIMKVGSVMIATEFGKIYSFHLKDTGQLQELRTDGMPLADIQGIYKVRDDVYVLTEAGVYKKSYARFLADHKPVE